VSWNLAALELEWISHTLPQLGKSWGDFPMGAF